MEPLLQHGWLSGGPQWTKHSTLRSLFPQRAEHCSKGVTKMSLARVYERQNSASSGMSSAILTSEILTFTLCFLLSVVLAAYLPLPFLMISLSPVFCMYAIAWVQQGPST